jgi:hypothetical protein
MPSSAPALWASAHGMPISHAIGANTQPIARSSVSGVAPTLDVAEQLIDQRDQAHQHDQHRADVRGQPQPVVGTRA